MDENASNNVAIDSDDDPEPSPSSADKPIIKLFKRLIHSDNKQTTMLTNAQIVDILDKEFGINIWDIHELEGEIYLTIMKKYLIEWPQWDEFDRLINNFKCRDDSVALNEMLESNYINLRDYLKVTLDRVQVLAKTTVNKLIEDKVKENKEINSDDVILEVHSSSDQLKQLIFRRPNPELNGTIFNHLYTEISQIKANILSLEAILNWWDVKISIQRGSVSYYERKTIHQLIHVLVNKNFVSTDRPLKLLPQECQITTTSKPEERNHVDTFQYIAWIDRLEAELPYLEPLFNFVKFDLRLLPDHIYPRNSYRRYTNKYPYVRYFYKDVQNPDINTRKYDLQLEETISPMYRLYIGHVQYTVNTIVEVECVPCSRKFSGLNLIDELKAHFDVCHLNETDWKCTNCKKNFPMPMLAKSWWTHRC